MSESLEEKTDYIICPVRNVTEEEREIIYHYVVRLESTGKTVHYPPRDVEQDKDEIGIEILSKHRKAMKDCWRVHIFFNETSKGSLHDLGMAFVLDKPIYLINRADVEKKAVAGKKSFENVLLYLDDKARKEYGNPLN